MLKRRAEIFNEENVKIATFIETCHEYRGAIVTVRLHPPLAPFNLAGTEVLALFAQGAGEAVIFVEASDPSGIEISEFHGKSAIGCVADGTNVTLVKSPGGDLSTLLIILGRGTVKPAH